MKYFFVINSLILTIFYQSFSQFSADADGQLNISPVNGNLNYTYPISSASYDGFKINVSLDYCQNVVHTAYNMYLTENNETCQNCDGWTSFSVSYPAWFMSVNGFVINVFKDGNTSFFSGSLSGCNWWEKMDPRPLFCSCDDLLPQGASLISMKENGNFQFLIPGYDVCNRIQSLSNPDDQDVIKILKSDGSVLELRNPIQRKDVASDNSDSLFTGFYYENAINAASYAIVEYDSVKYFTDIFKKIYTSNINSRKNNWKSFIPRKIRYFDGSGLQYTFNEYIAPFGTRIFMSNCYTDKDKILVGSPVTVFPTVFYLESINSSNKLLIDFKRNYHYPTNKNPDFTRGRAKTIEFDNHKFYQGQDYDIITSFGKSLKIFHIPLAFSCQGSFPMYYAFNEDGGTSSNKFDPFIKSNVNDIDEHYNNKRLHSSLFYLRPIDFLTGNVDELLKARQDKLDKATEKRIEYWKSKKKAG